MGHAPAYKSADGRKGEAAARRGRRLAALALAAGMISGGCQSGRIDDQTERVMVGGQTIAVEWLLKEDFEDGNWTERWTVESQGSSAFAENGQLRIRRGDVPRERAGITVWYDEDLPADVIVMVEASTEPGEHACNLNFFLHARESDGAPLVYGRSGAYPEYHSIPNYLFTFTGGYMPGWSRARRNPGFTLINDDSAMRSEAGASYTITLLCHDGHLSFLINGRRVHEFVDKNPLPGGRFGLRTWNSDINHERVRIGRIRP